MKVVREGITTWNTPMHCRWCNSDLLVEQPDISAKSYISYRKGPIVLYQTECCVCHSALFVLCTLPPAIRELIHARGITDYVRKEPTHRDGPYR